MSEVIDEPDADESESAEAYGTVELNERGRLTIPAALREDLNLGPGDQFSVIREGASIRLVRELPALETLTREEEWGPDAFRDAGTATFGSHDA
ncbi:MAG: AbrB/MazE/SpoVT family DNA-binding domain-containing protein [Halobacteriales archaeon]